MSDEHDHTDLGVSPKELYDSPEVASQSPQKPPDKIYPSFRYEGPEELHLPESGKMEIHFLKRSETSRTKPGGQHWYECCIEVRCFGDVESDEPKSPTTRSSTEAETALDTLARALGKSRDEEDAY
jgi:hypothetical protein